MATATTSLRNRIIDAAIGAGKFPATRRAHYERMWASNPTETLITIGSLTAIPPVENPPPWPHSERGVAALPAAGGGFVRAGTATPPAADDAYPLSWLSPAEHDRIAAAQQGEAFVPTVIYTD